MALSKAIAVEAEQQADMVDNVGTGSSGSSNYQLILKDSASS